MKRLMVILFAGALVACGQDSGTEPELPSIDAAKRAATEAGEAAGQAASETAEAAAGTASEMAEEAEEAAGSLTASEAGDEQSARCLDLVANAEYSQAIPVCTAALQANPANQQVQEALATAREKAADVAGAADAATEAAKQGAQEAASDAASDAAGQAAGGLLGQ